MKRQQVQRTRTSCHGQAAVEFLIAIVTVLAVGAGLLQIVALSNAQLDMLYTARARAAHDAMSDARPMSDPDYIRFWDAGPDQIAYTRDDTKDAANASSFKQTIVDKAVPTAGDWYRLEALKKDEIADVHASPMPYKLFGLVGDTETTNVDLIPAVRDLLYNADKIKIEGRVWSAWPRKIY